MKKLYIISICIMTLLLGIGVYAGVTLSRDKQIKPEDKFILDKANVTGYQVSAIKCSTEKCDDVCITWNTKFSTMCFTPTPYDLVCKEEQPIINDKMTEEEKQAVWNWKCPEYIKVPKTKEQLESEVSNFEDASLNRIITREKINQITEDKSVKSEISPSVDVTIKGEKTSG